MTTMDAYDPVEAMEYDRMARQDDARGPVPCRVCGNDPCTCGHHEEPIFIDGKWWRADLVRLALDAGLLVQPSPGVYEPTDLGRSMVVAQARVDQARRQRLADEQREAGQYLARGGDRL